MGGSREANPFFSSITSVFNSLHHFNRSTIFSRTIRGVFRLFFHDQRNFLTMSVRYLRSITHHNKGFRYLRVNDSSGFRFSTLLVRRTTIRVTSRLRVAIFNFFGTVITRDMTLRLFVRLGNFTKPLWECVFFRYRVRSSGVAFSLSWRAFFLYSTILMLLVISTLRRYSRNIRFINYIDQSRQGTRKFHYTQVPLAMRHYRCIAQFGTTNYANKSNHRRSSFRVTLSRRFIEARTKRPSIRSIQGPFQMSAITFR